jgi:hypothetical protein
MGRAARFSLLRALSALLLASPAALASHNHDNDGGNSWERRIFTRAVTDVVWSRLA